MGSLPNFIILGYVHCHVGQHQRHFWSFFSPVYLAGDARTSSSRDPEAPYAALVQIQRAAKTCDLVELPWVLTLIKQERESLRLRRISSGSRRVSSTSFKWPFRLGCFTVLTKTQWEAVQWTGYPSGVMTSNKFASLISIPSTSKIVPPIKLTYFQSSGKVE